MARYCAAIQIIKECANRHGLHFPSYLTLACTENDETLLVEAHFGALRHYSYLFKVVEATRFNPDRKWVVIFHVPMDLNNMFRDRFHPIHCKDDSFFRYTWGN